MAFGAQLLVSNMGGGRGGPPGAEIWTSVKGLLSFKIVRSSHSSPGFLEATIVWRDEYESALSVFQRVAIYDGASPVTFSSFRPLFVGRVYEATPQQDYQRGRTLRIVAYDYLASLADNNIDVGFDRTHYGYQNGRNDLYEPRYISLLPGSLGPFRGNIIGDLAMNIVWPPHGIDVVTIQGMPTASRMSNVNFLDLADWSILDAIKVLADEDPHDSTPTAIGGVFTMNLSQGGLNLNVASYWGRGLSIWDPNVRFSEGKSTIINGIKHIPVFEYDAPDRGYDIFTRARIYGRGMSVDLEKSPDPNTLGVGFINQDVENAWDPGSGRYAVRKQIVQMDPSLSSTENLRDRARGLMNLSPSTYRGTKTGYVTVAGWPRSTVGQLIEPGQLVTVDVPSAKLQGNYVVDSITYEYPRLLTTLQLARREISSIDEAVATLGNKTRALVSGHMQRFDSGWIPIQDNAQVQLLHLIGVEPRDVTVFAAIPDPTQEKAVISGSVIQVPPAQPSSTGEWIGYDIINNNTFLMTIGFGKWLGRRVRGTVIQWYNTQGVELAAEDSDTGQATTGTVVVRVLIRP